MLARFATAEPLVGEQNRPAMFDDRNARRCEALRERHHVLVAHRHVGVDDIGDPAGERQAAGTYGLLGQERVVQAAQANADDEQHRQAKPARYVQHVVPRAERHERPARAFYNYDVGARREARVRSFDRREIDGYAGRGRCEMRRYRRDERVRIAVSERRFYVASLRERGDIIVDRGALEDARRDRLHPDGATSRRDVRTEQRQRDVGLAHAGIGPGDEEIQWITFALRAPVRAHRGPHHDRGGHCSLTMVWPSAVLRGSPFHAWP